MKASQIALFIFFACYLTASTIIIIESSIVVATAGHHYTVTVLLVVGDSLFFLGPTILCIGAFKDAQGIEGFKLSSLGWRHLELGTFVIFAIAGGLFTIGSSLVLAYKYWPAVVLWMVGSGLFVVAAFAKLLVDQQILSHLYKKDFTHGEEKTPQFRKKERMLWFNVVGQNVNFASACVISVGSALFFVETRPFVIAGSICWIIAAGLLIIGTLFKMLYAFLELSVLRDNARAKKELDSTAPGQPLVPSRK